MQENFQQVVLRELKRLVEPLMLAASDADARNELFLLLGWDLTKINSGTLSTLQTQLAGLNTAYTIVVQWVQSPPDTLEEVTEALEDTKTLFDTIQTLNNTNAPSLQDFDEVASDVSELLAGSYLQHYHPVLFRLFVVLGLIEDSEEQAPTLELLDDDPPHQIVRVPYRKHKIHLDRLVPLLSDPLAYFQSEYQIPSNTNWLDPNATKVTADKLFLRLANLFNILGIRNSFGYDPNLNIGFDPDNALISDRSLLVYLTTDDAQAQFGLCFSLSDALNGDLGLVVTPFGSLTFSETYKSWVVDLVVSSSISGFAISYNDFTFPAGVSRIGGTLDITKSAGDDGNAFLVGSTTGTHIRIEGFKIGGNFELSSALREYGLYVQLTNAAFVLSPGDGDGFLQKILPANGMTGEFDLKLMWSNLSGFHFEGSAGLELKLPIHKTIANTLTIDSLIVEAALDTNLELIAAITGKLDIGPFTAVFEEVGLSFAFDFPPGKDGNLGALDASVGFKPPTGLGLSLKTDTIKGGGFLSFDKAEGRYVGALELSIKDKIAIKAVGILTTKLPGGQQGYSLLLMISAEFQPIQLGFGFTLNGVGGIIALHRSLNLEALRDGVRNNTINNILFPSDPVGNISNIISSLESTFPIAENRFSFGPMAKIGWGTPTLITADVGLFIELPEPVYLGIIGVVRAVLPDENKKLLQLQINFAGTFDFAAKFITFDAALFDSKLLWWSISGQMAFRLKYGDNPNFVLSVGGFHPSFPIPPLGIPPLSRVTINLITGDNPRLTLSSYFAVTSNTAQTGAAADFYFRVTDKIRITGGISFDALFQFSPFYFTATIKGSMGVYRNDDCVVGLWFEGTLEGPTPWRLHGGVEFKVLGVKFSRSFDRQIGDHVPTVLDEYDVLTVLAPALQDKANWQATLPTSLPPLVTLREIPAQPGEVVIYPQGMIAVNQKVVPLDMPIARYGNQRPKFGRNRFSLELTDGANVAYPKTNLKEDFSPGQYFDMSESDRLNRAAFEKYNAGVQVSITGNKLKCGGFREMEIRYELIYMDSRYRPIKWIDGYAIENSQCRTFLSGGSAPNSPIGSNNKPASFYAPAQSRVSNETYGIAQTHNGALYNSMTAGSEAEALLMLEDLLAANPALEGKLNVVPSFELA